LSTSGGAGVSYFKFFNQNQNITHVDCSPDNFNLRKDILVPTFIVNITKIDPNSSTGEQNVSMITEARSAIEAITLVDQFTGARTAIKASAEMTPLHILPKKER
jgi:hypothetical protein